MFRIATATGLFLVALGAVLRFWSGDFGGAQRHIAGDITLIAGAVSLLIAVARFAAMRLPVTRRSEDAYRRRYRTDASYAQNPQYADNSRYAQNPRYCQDPRYTVDD
jgi:hypothetical protein